jgi:hypothetical protein
MPHAALQTKPNGPEAATKRPEGTRSSAQRDPGQPSFAAPGSRLAGSPRDILLKLQRSHGNRYVQRLVQRSGMGLGGGPVSSETEGAIERARGAGQALDSTARSFLEESMGADFGNVRVHTGPQAEALNRSLSARAFTTGSDVFFARGEYQPGSSNGRELLAHELTHVVQQGAAREVRRKCAECEEEERKAAGEAPALQAKLVVGGADDAYEREADAVARQVMRAPAVQRKCARCQAEEEQAARRQVRRAPSSVVRRAPRLKTVTQPPSAALSVSLEGLYFEPAESGVFEAGPKAPQLLALALNRLLGSQYRPELVDPVFALLDRRKQARHGGFQAGQTAKAGEPMGRTGLSLPAALVVLDYLEKELKLKVELTPEQREVLEKGFATWNAWDFLRHEAEIHEKPLPSWYTIELFFMEMGQQGAFLKEYQEALKLIKVNRQAAENVGLLTVTRLHNALLAPLQAMEAIRTDTSLATNEKTKEIYARLWNVEPPGPGGAVSAPTQVAKPFAAGLFLAWLRSQSAVAEQAVTDPARRVLLLERYGRFLGQATMKGVVGGVQQVRDTPATANRPPFRSTLSVVPPVKAPLYDAALGTDHRFTHQVEFPDVWAALGSYGFAWERVRIPDDKIGQPVDPDTLKGEEATTGEVASVRFGRATRYAKADIEKALAETETDLGPPGVAALTLVGANAILRYAGTGIQLAIEIFTRPQDQKQIVFPEPGLYLVRGIMSPYLKGEEEVVRAPSVAYYPVLARDPDEMATAGVTQAAKSREAAKARLAEIDAKLKTGLDDKERQTLLAEREDLERSLGPVGAALEHQKAELTKYVADLEAGRQQGDLDAAKQQLGELGKILDVRARRKLPAGESPVAHFVSDLGRSLPLNLEIVDKPKVGGHFHVLVSDLTTHKSGLQEGYGATRDKAILSALKILLEGIHGYGRGRVAIQLGGVPHTQRIEASLGNLLMESIDNVTLVLSLAAVVAAPLTEGVSLALLIPLGVVGAVPSAYRVVEGIEAGTFTLDLEGALELVNVVGSVIGIARVGAGALRLVRVGRGLLILGYGADALGAVLLGASVVDQINTLQGLPEGERAAALTMLLGQTMLNVGITVGGALAHRAHQARLEARLQAGHPEPARLPAGEPAPGETAHPPSAPAHAEPVKPPVPSEPAAKPPEKAPAHPTAGEAEEKRSGRDVVAADAPPQPGSLGPESEWTVGTNSVGATVFRSDTLITGDPDSPAHLEGLVVRARRTGRPVTIITGYHGGTDGQTRPAPEFARYDKEYYGQKYPDVNVIDTSEMSHEQRMEVIDSTRGVVIAATCFGSCARPSPGKATTNTEGRRPTIRDIEPATPGAAPPPSGSAAELGKESDWVLAKNAAGAQVFKSLTPISANPAHVEGIVVWARRQGKKVTLFTGYYGSESGGTFPEKRFALDDAKFFGKRYPDVEIVDTSDWTHDQRMAAIEATPGVVIVSTCYGACARPTSAPVPARPGGAPLALPPGESAKPQLALPPAGGTSGPPVRVTVEEMFHRYAVEEDLKRLGSVNEETKPLLEKNDKLREALVESPLAALVLKKCSSPCFPPNATPEQIQRLERYLRNVGPGYDETALRTYLYDRRGELTAAIAQLEQSKTPAELNAKLAFFNTKGEKGIEKLPAREDPRIRGELVERSHDIGVKYGEIQAKADGLVDVGFENPIRIGGFDQGFDDVMRKGPNLDTGDVYIVEYKGGSAQLAPGQMEFDWVVGNIRRLYAEGGSVGQSWARILAKALREGRLKGVAYATRISAGSPLPTTTVGTWTYKPTRIVF